MTLEEFEQLLTEFGDACFDLGYWHGDKGRNSQVATTVLYGDRTGPNMVVHGLLKEKEQHARHEMIAAFMGSRI